MCVKWNEYPVCPNIWSECILNEKAHSISTTSVYAFHWGCSKPKSLSGMRVMKVPMQVWVTIYQVSLCKWGSFTWSHHPKLWTRKAHTWIYLYLVVFIERSKSKFSHLSVLFTMWKIPGTFSWHLMLSWACDHHSRLDTFYRYHILQLSITISRPWMYANNHWYLMKTNISLTSATHRKTAV